MCSEMKYLQKGKKKQEKKEEEVNRQTANEPLPSSIQSGQRGVENACEFLQILWCIHNNLFSAIDLHLSAGQEAVHKLQPVDLKKPVHQSETWQTLCYWWGPAKNIPIILYCALIMSHSDCTFIPSCSPITSHSAQSFHLVHPSLHTLHSHSTLHCSPIISHSAQSFQSALFTYHFTLCTVIPICIVHPSCHTLHIHSILFTHHITLCTFIPSCSPIMSHSALSFHPVHPSHHTLHIHSILFTHHFTLCTVIPSSSPIMSHSALSFHPVHPSHHTLHIHSILFTHHFTLRTAIPICIVHPSRHTMQSFQSALFTHHVTLCSHSNLHCSPITSHSIAPHTF